MTFGIRKSIDIVSPADGQRYTSITQYEKSLHSRGQDIMTDKSFKETVERLRDTEKAPPPKRDESNHIHIDFNNGTVTKEKRDWNVR